MGVTDATHAFSTQQYSDSFKLFQKTVISPIQDVIVEAINKIIGEDAVSIVPFAINFEI